MNGLFIESCWATCSIQDGGRRGLRRMGFPRSGAMDLLALAAANVLVGNRVDCAGIELLLGGMTLKAVGGPIRLALAGAEFPLELDGLPVPSHQSFVVDSGQRLRIGPARRGVCAILAVEGGLDVPVALGSTSLHPRSRTGGLFGRFLQPGDRIPVRGQATVRDEFYLPPIELGLHRPIRVTLGPQSELFTSRAIELFLQAEFKLSQDCDRMAYRLSGPAIRPRRSDGLVSDGIFEGAVQMTAAGQPIAMLADHQTVGGYPKIAAIVSQDIRVLANRRPGDTIKWSLVTVPEAQKTLRHSKSIIDQLHLKLRSFLDGVISHDYHTIGLLAGNAINAIDEGSWVHDKSGAGATESLCIPAV